MNIYGTMHIIRLCFFPVQYIAHRAICDKLRETLMSHRDKMYRLVGDLNARVGHEIPNTKAGGQ